MVEFIGLPGSGKSTLATELRSILCRNGLEVHGPLGGDALGENPNLGARLSYHRTRLWSALRLAAADPRFTSKACRELASTGQGGPRELSTLVLDWLSKTALTRALRSRRGVVLLDEGMLHAAWSVNYSAHRRRLSLALLTEAYGDRGDRPWFVVEVRIPPQLAIQRVERRDGHRHRMARGVARVGREGVVRQAEEALSSVQDALAAWADEGRRVTLLQVDNDQAVEVAVQVLAREVIRATLPPI